MLSLYIAPVLLAALLVGRNIKSMPCPSVFGRLWTAWLIKAVVVSVTVTRLLRLYVRTPLGRAEVKVVFADLVTGRVLTLV